MTRILPALIAGLMMFCAPTQCVSQPTKHGDPSGWNSFLDTLQLRALKYFVETGNPSTGLMPDRWPASYSPSSIAAVGFGMTAYPIAVERGLIARQDAAAHILHLMRYLYNLPQDGQPSGSGYKGFYYHFLTMNEGKRTWNSELSTIDTGWLMAGVLCCMSYFDGENAGEKTIRSLADSLYKRVEWDWAMADKQGIALGWTPEHGFHPEHWQGYDEAMVLYILALGSPTHPVPASVWDVWTKTYVWAKYRGQEFISFAPLFGHQYSHCWIDFRGIRDSFMQAKGIDYFENSRRATYAQQAYAIENPARWADYADTIWGFTACDGPGDATVNIDGVSRRFKGYAARGASIDWSNDDGTIAPTAVAGSVPFAPEVCIPTLQAFRNRYDSLIWKQYGFVDAFNPTYRQLATGKTGWYDQDYLGIDQGPIALMLENYRSELIWNLMKKCPYIVRGLERAGFTGGWLSK